MLGSNTGTNTFIEETGRKTHLEQVPEDSKDIIILRVMTMRNGVTITAEEMKRQELFKQELNDTRRE